MQQDIKEAEDKAEEDQKPYVPPPVKVQGGPAMAGMKNEAPADKKNEQQIDPNNDND